MSHGDLVSDEEQLEVANDIAANEFCGKESSTFEGLGDLMASGLLESSLKECGTREFECESSALLQLGEDVPSQS